MLLKPGYDANLALALKRRCAPFDGFGNAGMRLANDFTQLCQDRLSEWLRFADVLVDAGVGHDKW